VNLGGFLVKEQQFAEITDASGLGAAYKVQMYYTLSQDRA
jgi:hypothetical protein